MITRRAALRGWALIGAGALLTSRRIARAADTIKIGALYNGSGPLAERDLPGLRGMRLATEQINAAGGLLGLPLELLERDCASDLAAVPEAATALIDSGVIALTGFNDLDFALAAGAAAQRRALPFVTAGAPIPALARLAGDEYFSACFTTPIQGNELARFARRQLPARTMWQIQVVPSIPTTGIGDSFLPTFTVGGNDFPTGGVTLARVQYEPGDAATAPATAKAQADAKGEDPPEMVMVDARSEDVVPIVRGLREIGVTAPIVGTDRFDTPALFELGAGAGDIYFATHVAYDNPARRVQQFVTDYTERYGSAPDSAWTASGYDALNLVADAVRRAGETTRRGTQRALSATDGFDGVTGPLTYVAGRTVDRLATPVKPVTIVRVRDGHARIVSQPVPQ